MIYEYRMCPGAAWSPAPVGPLVTLGRAFALLGDDIEIRRATATTAPEDAAPSSSAKYEARTGGGPWRRISPMRGESIDEVFRQLGPGAEVRQAQEAAGEASGVLDVASLAKRVEHGARLLDEMADRILSAAQREWRQAERYEALEGRVSQLEAVREMGARTW